MSSEMLDVKASRAHWLKEPKEWRFVMGPQNCSNSRLLGAALVPETQLSIVDPLHRKMCMCANLQFQRAHESELSSGIIC